MAKHVIRQGECAATIAAAHGISIADLRAENGPLFERRSNPFVLAPGDLVTVPDGPRTPTPLAVSAGGAHRFRATRPATTLGLCVRDDAGAPVAGRPFELHAGALLCKGTTGGEGEIEVLVPVSLVEIDLLVWFSAETEPRCFPLALGHLDPATHESGILHRLANLGYVLGAATPEATERAVGRFQDAEGLPVTGIADEATRAKLVERHGC